MACALSQAPDYDAVQRTATIRTKNDAFRSNLVGRRVVLTQGVNALAEHDRRTVLKAVQAFDDFSPGNDPYGEHDFGAVTVNDTVFFWKIDYYDRDLQNGSPDPADDAVTSRVLTIMRAEEYRAMEPVTTSSLYQFATLGPFAQLSGHGVVLHPAQPPRKVPTHVPSAHWTRLQAWRRSRFPCLVQHVRYRSGQCLPPAQDALATGIARRASVSSSNQLFCAHPWSQKAIYTA